MNPIFKYIIPYRFFYVDHSHGIYQKQGKLFRLKFGENMNSEILSLNTGNIIDKISYNIYIISRLLRKGVHYLIPIDENQNAFIYNKKLCITDGNQTIIDVPITGSRPLSFEKIGDELVFGEYRSNPERSPVSVYSINLKNNSKLQVKYTFENIRHIHGVYQDPYTLSIYITTGDENHEAAIWKTNDNFNTIEKVLSGSQQTRTIKLLFDENFIYFGSDAPHEKNYLYKLNKQSYEVKQLIEVGSSVFHGYKVDNWLFFSTAIEPSKINTTKFAELWASPDGNEWKCILKLKKDILPMRYFQYGQIFFPNGPGDGENLWISPFATKYSNKCISIDIKEVRRLYDL